MHIPDLPGRIRCGDRQAFAALVALIVASGATLVVPLAVRRMIDFGFSPEGIALINSYFSVMIAIVAVLAAASASPGSTCARWAAALRGASTATTCSSPAA
mgnify:CR=1 FL=1